MIYFVSYGNRRFVKSRERIANEAKAFGFDIVKIYTEADLSDDIRNNHVMQSERGGGYYLWKPYVILQTLKEMKEGDLLFYLDAGCKIVNNEKTRDIYNQYLKLLESNSVITCLTAKRPRLPGYTRYYEYQWTKRDLFNHLDANDFHNEIQVCSGFFLARKCDESVRLVKEWLETSLLYDCHFIRDTPSYKANYEGFVEHRHDQSVLSLLVRKYNHLILEDQILSYDMEDIYPFCAVRIRE